MSNCCPFEGIEREEQKIVKEIKKAAKEGQMEPVKMLAKEVARSRKAKERILIAKTNLNSMEMQIANSMSMMRVSGAMEKSAELMKLMNEVLVVCTFNDDKLWPLATCPYRRRPSWELANEMVARPSLCNFSADNASADARARAHTHTHDRFVNDQ